jgi:hypothetical protein
MTSPIIPTLLSMRTRIVMLYDALGDFLTSLRASVWLALLSFCIWTGFSCGKAFGSAFRLRL